MSDVDSSLPIQEFRISVERMAYAHSAKQTSSVGWFDRLEADYNALRAEVIYITICMRIF